MPGAVLEPFDVLPSTFFASPLDLRVWVESHTLLLRVPMEGYTSVTKVPPCSTACLLARLDEPQPCVDASRDACEEVSSVGVLKESSQLAGVAYMFAKGGKLRQ